MKILFWTDAFRPGIGGMEVFCANLLRALKKRGHLCEVITNQPGAACPCFSFEGTPVHPFPFEETLHRGDLKTAAAQSGMCSQLVDRFRPDVIHLHGITRGIFYFTRQQMRRRLPAVVTLHDNLAPREKRTMAAWTLAHAEQIIAISAYIYREARAAEPGLGSRLRTIRNALPQPDASPTAPLGQRLLVVGRFLAHKGFDLAIRAFASVAHEFPDMTLTLAGGGGDRSLLEALAADSGFSDRIRFTGWIEPDQMAATLDQHSVVLVPSRWQEPFGLVALQAAQRGRPALAGRTGALPEIVLDGITGILVENEKLSAWTESLRCLVGDPTRVIQMGNAARLHAATHFSFERLVDDYEQAYTLARQATL